MIRALFNGFIGACTLTLVHQLAKKLTPDAPRLDNLGRQGLYKLTKATGVKLSDSQMYKLALVSDIVSNTLYFSQVGNKRGFFTLARGLSLGSAAGVGSVALPEKLGLDKKATNQNDRTKIITVSMYALAGLAAALAAQATGKSK